MMEADHINLIFEESAIKAIHMKQLKENLAQGDFESALEEIMLDIMYTFPSYQNVPVSCYKRYRIKKKYYLVYHDEKRSQERRRIGIFKKKSSHKYSRNHRKEILRMKIEKFLESQKNPYIKNLKGSSIIITTQAEPI